MVVEVDLSGTFVVVMSLRWWSVKLNINYENLFLFANSVNILANANAMR